jgi:glycosyltransferase involved in cell wall biosynthesis
MIKVCFLLGGFTGYGGIGRVCSILVNNLCRDERYKIYTISFFHKERSDYYQINHEILQDYLFDEQINMKQAMLKGGIKKLKKYLSNNDIDILVACGALFYPISVLACKGTKTKCICWEHSNTYTTDDHSFQKACRNFGAKFSDYIIALTDSDKDYYISKYHVSNIRRIYNPIDIDLFERCGEYDITSKKIISVGRLTTPKNYDGLIDIAKVILTRREDWSWDVYGEGELRDYLQNRINAFNLQAKLLLKGEESNIYDVYKDYAFLVMTSKREGFPMVLLEAAANSLPLVSFDIATGPNEIIQNCNNGYLIEPFLKESMIECIDQLICNQESCLRKILHMNFCCSLT